MDETLKEEVVKEVLGETEVIHSPVLPTDEEVAETRAEIVGKLEAALELMKRAKFPTLVLVAAAPEFPITSKSKVEFVSSIGGEMTTARDLLVFTMASFGKMFDAAVAAQSKAEEALTPDIVVADAAEAP